MEISIAVILHSVRMTRRASPRCTNPVHWLPPTHEGLQNFDHGQKRRWQKVQCLPTVGLQDITLENLELVIFRSRLHMRPRVLGCCAVGF